MNDALTWVMLTSDDSVLPNVSLIDDMDALCILPKIDRGMTDVAAVLVEDGDRCPTRDVRAALHLLTGSPLRRVWSASRLLDKRYALPCTNR